MWSMMYADSILNPLRQVADLPNAWAITHQEVRQCFAKNKVFVTHECEIDAIDAALPSAETAAAATVVHGRLLLQRT